MLPERMYSQEQLREMYEEEMRHAEWYYNVLGLGSHTLDALEACLSRELENIRFLKYYQQKHLQQ